MSPRPALFGKLPRHGDFVSRGLPDPLHERWDARMSAEIVQARAATGDAFEATHEGGPCWRFLVRDDETWAAGAIAPSIDAAGRRFLIMAQVRELSVAEALACGAALAGSSEAAIYRALAEGLNVDALLGLLDAAACAVDAAAAGAWAHLDAQAAGDGAWWTAGSPARPPARLAGRWPDAGALLTATDPEREMAS